MVHDEYTDPRLDRQSLKMIGDTWLNPKEKAHTVTPKRYGRYKDANWMP